MVLLNLQCRSTMGKIWYNIFFYKVAAEPIKLETLQKGQLHSILIVPISKPGTGCCCKACLEPWWVWMDCRGSWLWASFYTRHYMSPKELLWFTSCNCHGDCNTQRCSCKNIIPLSVVFLHTYTICKGVTCKKCINHGIESRDNSNIDFWGVWQLKPYLNCNVYSNTYIYLLKIRFANSKKWVCLFPPRSVFGTKQMLLFNSES